MFGYRSRWELKMMPLIVGTQPLQTLAKTGLVKTEPRGYTNAGHATVCLSFIGFSSP